MNRNKTARQHNFATVPRADIPRSKFAMRQTRKQAFNASELIPIMCEEVLPGDTWQHSESILARLATPIAPLIDDLDLETFYFFVPNRITDENWEALITGSDETLQVPVIGPAKAGTPPTGELLVGSVFDHFGITPNTYTSGLFVNAYPIWAYITIWNEWFRDQNLQPEWSWPDPWPAGASNLQITNGATAWDQMPLRANKRHDYFTSSLPWPQKGDPVSFPFGQTAPIYLSTNAQTGDPFIANVAPDGATSRTLGVTGAATSWGAPLPPTPSGLTADVSAVAPTLNAIRMASITQKLLEQDARGGSRYIEQILSHFGVRSPDYRLQRPEYLGGSKIPITINPIAQTAAYDSAPDDVASALGNLGAEMHASGHKRTFTYAATEHGYIIGVALVRATPTYQQGTRRHWRRKTRLDFWFPEFDGLGEQAVATEEIYQPAAGTPGNETWGYQERAAEYRYTPNEITGLLRSTVPQPMDWWHLSEEFGSEPALNASFITDKTQEVLARCLATAPTPQWSAQIIMDIRHDSTVARLMPAYGVPGIDKF